MGLSANLWSLGPKSVCSGLGLLVVGPAVFVLSGLGLWAMSRASLALGDDSFVVASGDTATILLAGLVATALLRGSL